MKLAWRIYNDNDWEAYGYTETKTFSQCLKISWECFNEQNKKENLCQTITAF